MKVLTLSILVFFCSLNFTQAQIESIPNSKPIIIVTNDGGKFIGNVISEDQREILFNDKNKGEVYIPKYAIASREIINEENFYKSEIITKNSAPQHYNLTSSAIPLETGESLLKTHYYLYYQFEYGISDRFSLGAGTSIYTVPFFISGKYSIPVGEGDNIMINQKIGAVSILFVALDNFDRPELTGSMTSVTYTTGNRENNLSFGGGVITNFSGTTQVGFANISGLTRFGRKVSFCYEFIGGFSNNINLLNFTPSLKLHTEKNKAWNFGLPIVFTSDVNEAIILPLIGFNRHF